MFVPFVFNMSTFDEAPYLWWFYMGLDFAKRHHSAIIAQEIYCTTPPATFSAKGRKEAFDKAYVENWGYNLPQNRDLQIERIYSIPDQLLDKIVVDKGSISDAFCYLLMQPDERLVDFFSELIQKIETDCKEPIEAFITLLHLPSLSVAAEKNNIPVIHFEMGCWRKPKYINTSFWDTENLLGGATVEKRWNRFCREQKERPFPVFSKKECLALLLRKENLHYLKLFDRKPTKKMGVALGYVNYETFACKTHLNDSEILYRVRKKYGLQNMLVRRHFGDPYGGQYPRYASAMEPKGRSTLEFIADCETVVSLVSGTGIEAMLLDRKAITLLPSPSYFVSGHEIEREGLCAGEDFLSFFAFCYLIPWECLMNIDYMRWRLTNPTEREIYYKHIEFYFEKKQLPKELILQEAGNRLQGMLEAQDYKMGKS
ncbi:GT99 family glycosyltransferase N-terminal domain-containing protein [Provencibacterium massiliense]|uniref:GT99 family glycosyltransferase N-terminal domain-containing protein n=1 Tax=Provencibacterium massiliense TaxID=1841868 RepID=UPI00117B7957|nr:hypothetical protein [Provencibacterium massiliense]